MDADVAQAVLAEAQTLLDSIGEDGQVVLTPGDDGVAAVVGLVELVQTLGQDALFFRRTVQGMLAAGGASEKP